MWQSGWCNPWLLLLLSSDCSCYKLRLHLWVRGQWCKCYGSSRSIIILYMLQSACLLKISNFENIRSHTSYNHTVPCCHANFISANISYT